MIQKIFNFEGLGSNPTYGKKHFFLKIEFLSSKGWKTNRGIKGVIFIRQKERKLSF